MSAWEDEAEQLMTQAQKDQQELTDTKSWNPEEGDILTGILVSGDKVPTKYGPAKIMNIKDKDGDVWTVWCTPTMLLSQLDDKAPAKGKGVSVKYGGMREPKTVGGNRYKTYTLVVQETDHQYWLEITKAFRLREDEAMQSSGSSGHSNAPFDPDDAPY
jgi:hypothetical protein